MVATRGWVAGDDGKTLARTGHRYVTSECATWAGAIRTTVFANGRYEVIVRRDEGDEIIARGTLEPQPKPQGRPRRKDA